MQKQVSCWTRFKSFLCCKCNNISSEESIMSKEEYEHIHRAEAQMEEPFSKLQTLASPELYQCVKKVEKDYLQNMPNNLANLCDLVNVQNKDLKPPEPKSKGVTAMDKEKLKILCSSLSGVISSCEVPPSVDKVACLPSEIASNLQPVYKPAVPFQNVIRGGLKPGQIIIIQGVVHPDASKFTVDLCFESGIAFHYNPRFNENTVVRNTLINNVWGYEERNGPMPFQRGQPFTMTICCEPQWFRIFVNGMQTHEYRHRLHDLQQVTSLEIYRDVTLTSVVL